jgi:alkylated DNA repair dioxygenase AlkB
MGTPAEALERELRDDLATLAERFGDEEFSSDLYRALANNRWEKEGGPEGRVSLSWSRAERLVNELRERAGQPPLTLAQTGGEGEVSSVVEDELSRLGWRREALDTSQRDDAHLAEPESPPPADQGARQAGVDDPGAWERQAHAEADRTEGRIVDE